MTNPMMQSVAAIARRKANAGGGTPTQVVTNGPFGTIRTDYGGWVGFSFSIAASQTITALSKWSPAASAATVNVKLWTDGGTELASVNVDDTLGSDEWLDVSITPLVLSAGTYRIAAFANSHFHDKDTSYTLATGFTKVNAIYGGGSYADTDDGASAIYVPVGFIFEA